MCFLRLFFILLYLLPLPSLAAAADGGGDCTHPKIRTELREPIKKLIQSFVDSTEMAKRFVANGWTERVQTAALDINQMAGLKLEPGRAYGAIVLVTLKHPLAEVRRRLERSDAFISLLNNIKTFRDTKPLPARAIASESVVSCFQLSIKVPVVPDYHCEDRVAVEESNNRRTIVKWDQISDRGDLDDNAGAEIFEPDGENTKLTIIGVHIIKREKRVPWIGRSTATSFAKDHYANFAKAMERLLD